MQLRMGSHQLGDCRADIWGDLFERSLPAAAVAHAADVEPQDWVTLRGHGAGQLYELAVAARADLRPTDHNHNADSPGRSLRGMQHTYYTVALASENHRALGVGRRGRTCSVRWNYARCVIFNARPEGGGRFGRLASRC